MSVAIAGHCVSGLLLSHLVAKFLVPLAGSVNSGLSRGVSRPLSGFIIIYRFVWIFSFTFFL